MDDTLIYEPGTGFEPVTSALPERCSNQLSYPGKNNILINIIHKNFCKNNNFKSLKRNYNFI